MDAGLIAPVVIAAALYSGEGFHGPRLLSVDEIDAAFDELNLRQVLALLRSWDFDVLATAPFMTPMIKQEAGPVMVHQVVTAGRHQVTAPWLWRGPRPGPLRTAIHDRLCSGQAPETIAAVRVPTLPPAGFATLRSWLDTAACRRSVRSVVAVSATGVRVPLRELLTVLGLTTEDLSPLVERAVSRPVEDSTADRRTAATLRQGL
ncbi:MULTISPECIES: hypothetical protein [Streptomyces]|uniref:Uncharacterized protein n=1 Tax=Streptomyces doudnae TaxID=3075536 RepID=A0ABD5EF53_9ACTN|nr:MULTISPECIES: hypothetical protein [unclassified Streptomyces]MDT0433306.1 hypothetical protein [Streptomyces sp. DSM 41981]SCE42845.1 hypothetical protein GA0115242_13703 [Streptomyces sp. SolWspMP-5a-2]